jgi:hypothetical protein
MSFPNPALTPSQTPIASTGVQDVWTRLSSNAKGPSSFLPNWFGMIEKDEEKEIGCGGFGTVYRVKWSDPILSDTLPNMVVKIVRAVGGRIAPDQADVSHVQLAP